MHTHPPTNPTNPAGLTLRYHTGKVWQISELPPRSIALDGAVQGPHIDVEQERFSFDHHAHCIRHATLATCEQVRDALLLGFDPSGFQVWVNDVDSDTVVSYWLLQNRHLLWGERGQELAQMIHHIGRLDALGIGYGGYTESHPLHWHLTPPPHIHRTEELFLEKLACVQRYWDHPQTFQAKERPPVPFRMMLWVDGQVQMMDAPEGIASLYAQTHFGIIWGQAPANTYAYTVAKKSEFVAFSVEKCLAELAQIEAGWGGGSTIGGAPRHPDGSRSHLTPAQVAEVFGRFVTHTP